MIEHTALYRKYRPASFKDVRGQEPIVKALEGAVKTGKIPHALLFAGSRGTGKTSIARIFASAIGTSAVDVYEIDAASNRRIDDVRELREAAYSLPYESEKKVYIIDEVHMLTKEAFNALLKILEEPPQHVVFILATTELDKLLDTIISRCQVFSFRAPSRQLLAETVIDIAKKEKFALAPAAADLVALSAGGSFRDAIGIAEKVIMASEDDKAEADEVAEIIGAPKSALVMQIVTALKEKDTEEGLSAVADALRENIDMELFMRLILERVRAVMLVRHGEKEVLEMFGEDEKAEIEAYAKETPSVLNSQALVRLLEAAESMRRVQMVHLPLELAVIDITAEE